MNWTLKIIVHAVQLGTVIVIAWFLARKKLSQPYRIFAAGWLLVLVFDLTMVVIGLINPVKNHWIYNLAFIFQHTLLVWFFARLLKERRIEWLVAVYLVFALADLFWLQGTRTLNTYSMAMAGIMVISLAVLRLFELYRTDTPKSLFREPDFWYCSGFILYWSLATPYFVMFNYLWDNFTRFSTVYFFTFSYGCMILLNVSIIKALLCQRTIPK